MSGEHSTSRVGAADGPLLQQLLDQAPAMIAACDPRGVYLYVNDEFANACGSTPAAIVGRRDDDLTPDGMVPRLLRPGESAAGDANAAVGEGTIGGRRTRVLTVRYPVRSPAGDVVATCLIASPLANDDEIRSSLESAVERNTELLRALDQMERLAYTDRLTGAWNRRHLDDAAVIEMSRAERHGFPVSVLMLDIDHFKKINDTYGHLAGDSVLRGLATILQKRLRPNDRLGRYGGEEFCAILPETALANAAKIGEELRALVEAHAFVADDKRINVTISIGAGCLDDSMDIAGLYRRADEMLYQAKRTGRNKVCH